MTSSTHRKKFALNTLRLKRFEISQVTEKDWVPRYLAQTLNYRAAMPRLMDSLTYVPTEVPPLTSGMLFISLYPEYCDKIFFEAVVEGAVCRFDVTQCLNLLDPVVIDSQLQNDPLPNLPLYAAYLSQGSRHVKTRENGTRYFDFLDVDNFGMFTLDAGIDALEIRDLLTNQTLPLNFTDPRFQLNPCAKLESLLKTKQLGVWKDEQAQQPLVHISLLTEKPASLLEGVLFFVYSWGISTPPQHA